MAERLGLMRALGRHVLERAHEAGRALVAESGGPVTISVNLSPAQVSDPALAEAVARLRESDPDVQLVLEITEGTFIGDDAETVQALHVLKAAGALLAVDDFGVGYSSIGYLHRLPLDILKIDKSFVHQLDDPRAFSLVQGVVSLARSMELTVVVEGVETWADAIAVRELGCGLAQGFLFCSAVPLEEALDLIRRGGVDVGPLQRTTRAVRAPRSR
jgi:EAL domain-containing protein (putative c-di-GMP-specific phosphodiesterase class I)